MVGVASTSSVYAHLKILEEKGYIARKMDASRACLLYTSLLLLFLIRFVNHYMLRRKQKEFAVLSIMGMEQKTIGRIFFAETLKMCKRDRYSIKVNEVRAKEGSNIKGFATVVFGDSFKITNIAIPVSYTHLPQNPTSTMEMWKIREQAKMQAEEVVLNQIVTVSYTHLDCITQISTRRLRSRRKKRQCRKDNR